MDFLLYRDDVAETAVLPILVVAWFGHCTQHKDDTDWVKR